jgi:hypothetical protein
MKRLVLTVATNSGRAGASSAPNVARRRVARVSVARVREAYAARAAEYIDLFGSIDAALTWRASWWPRPTRARIPALVGTG